MSYMCIKSNKECDGCQDCKQKDIEELIYCDICDSEIEEVYFDIDGCIYCEECVNSLFRRFVEY